MYKNFDKDTERMSREKKHGSSKKEELGNWFETDA